MGSCEGQSSSSRSSSHRPASLKINKNGGNFQVKQPRIIHTYSPKVYKIQPEEFLDLVQKLTGQCASEETTTFFFETDLESSTEREGIVSEEASRTRNTRNLTFQDLYENNEAAYVRNDELASPLSTPRSTQLLSALPSPRFVTLNFLPMLSPSTSGFNTPRNTGISLY